MYLSARSETSVSFTGWANSYSVGWFTVSEELGDGSSALLGSEVLAALALGSWSLADEVSEAISKKQAADYTYRHNHHE